MTPETVQDPDTNAPKTPSGGTMKGKALPIFATIVVLIWVIMLSRPELLRPEPSMICTIAIPLTRAMAMVSTCLPVALNTKFTSSLLRFLRLASIVPIATRMKGVRPGL